MRAKNEITAEYQGELISSKYLGACVRKVFMQQIIREKKISNGVTAYVKIPPSTIYSRVSTGNIEINGLGLKSPMCTVDP